jgi:hypothetical protein
MRELMIRSETPHDGMGRPYRMPNIAVGERRISPAGQVSDAAARTTEADGLLVCVEWFDIHDAHDGPATPDPRLAPLVPESR